LEEKRYKDLWFKVQVEDGGIVTMNTAAYADDLILYAETRAG
jgi:hypothetical protein